LPLPVRPDLLLAPDWMVRGLSFAQDTRCPAVGNRLMSSPIACDCEKFRPPLAARDKAAALACSSEAGLLPAVLSKLALLRTIPSIVTIPVTV
jgi:hypothetical protein